MQKDQKSKIESRKIYIHIYKFIKKDFRGVKKRCITREVVVSMEGLGMFHPPTKKGGRRILTK